MKCLVYLLLFSCIVYSVRCSHVNFGSRYPYPSDDSNYQDNKIPSSLFDNNQVDTDSWPNYDPRDQDYPNEDTCSIENTFRNSIPTGRTKVTFITALDKEDSTLDNCVKACCEQGPVKCQYAWMFSKQCFMVGCSKEDSSLCEPVNFPRKEMSTTYVKVHSPVGVFTEAIAPTTISQSESTTISSTTTMTTEEVAPTNKVTPMDRPQGSTKEIAVTPIQVQTTDSEAPPTTTSKPHPLTTTTQKAKANNHGIIVATDGDTDITLPTTTAKIFGNTWPKPTFPGAYLYKWEKISGPEQGTIVGKDSKDVTLRDLVPGLYTLKLKVQNWVGSGWGEGFINITVNEATHVNSPPVPVILPASESVITLPQDSIVLDAQSSTDDRGEEGLTFHWEEVAGPLGSDLEVDSPLLKLSGLTEGVHEYKLTVTDVDGAVAVATAKVTVLAEKDYPPVAHAGNPVILHLPNNEATLDGSQSKDEGELTYKWTYLSGPGGGDMEGANTPKLHVSHLTLGDHQYQLTVTDSSGQTSTDSVSVIVTAEDNKPPVANAGGNMTIVFPVSDVVLYGNKSSDDYLINSFSWTQIHGPTDVTLSGTTTSSLTVSNLHIDESVGSPTVYQFRLTVVDYRNLTDTDVTQIIYTKDPEVPPVASTGPDVNITLPQSTVVLDGTGSNDDFGIVSYQWVRSKNSPAAGKVVNHSDQTPTLILSNLVNGTYTFTLKVTNKNGETALDNVTLRVFPNPSDKFLLQVHLDGDITRFSDVDLEQFKLALRYLLYGGKEEYDIQVLSVSPYNSHIMVEFYAMDHKMKIMNTTQAYYKLTEKGQDYVYNSFHIVKIEMKICQLPCSGHGTCDIKTKKCQCSTFWMENPFKSRVGKMESNCEWSVFYVILVVVGVVVVVFFALWLCCCCCLKRRRRSRSKRRIRYAILDHKDQDTEAMQMLPRDYKQTSLMVSESETEEEILFESSRKTLNNDTGKGTKNNSSSRVKNGKILTSVDKVGNQSSSRGTNNNSD